MCVRPGPAGFHLNVLQLLPHSQKFTSQPKPNSEKAQTNTAGVLASLYRSAFSQAFILCTSCRASASASRDLTCGFSAGAAVEVPPSALRGARSPERGFEWCGPKHGITEPCFCFCFSSLLGKINRGDVSESLVLDTGSCMLLFGELVSLQA